MVGSLTPLGVLANVKAACAEVVEAAARAGQPVRNVWGYGEGPDHNNRRCIDFMIETTRQGDWSADYLWAHRERLGLELLIWNRRIRRTYRKGLIPAGRWARYRGPHPHTDHVHAQFAAGEYEGPRDMAPGLWVVDPARVSTTLLELGRDGKVWRKRPPGYVVRDGSHIVRQGGREWLVTKRGTRLAREYLRRP